MTNRTLSSIVFALLLGAALGPMMVAPVGLAAEDLSCSAADAAAIARNRKRKNGAANAGDAVPRNLKELSEAQRNVDKLARDAPATEGEVGRLQKDLNRLKGQAAAEARSPTTKAGFRDGALAEFTQGKYEGPKDHPRIGVFAGAFDPPGNAQREAILHALEAGELDEVWVVTQANRGDAPRFFRSDMAEKAFSGHPRVKFLDNDLASQSHGKMLESLAALNRNGTIVNISGAESLKNPLLGAARAGNIEYLLMGKPTDGAMIRDVLKAKFGELLKKDKNLARWVDGPDPEENALAKSSKGVPEEVQKFIDKRRMYAGKSPERKPPSLARDSEPASRPPAPVAKAAPPALKAPFDPEHQAEFAKLVSPPRSESLHPGSAPQFHTMNTDETFAALAKRKNPEFRILSSGNDKRGFDEYCESSMGICFVATAPVRQEGGKLVVPLKDTLGRWFTVTGDSPAKGGKVKLNFPPRSFEPYQVDLTADVKRIREFSDSTRLGKMNAEELGNFLTSRQLVSSSNDAAAKGPAREAFEHGIRESNGMLADLLVNGKEFSAEHMERMNWYANRGINPYEEKDTAAFAGVMRGTNDRVAFKNGEFVRQDLSKFQVVQGDNEDDRLVKNYFLPASKVPAKVDELVARINKLDRSTDATEVFSIYKDFVETHPFADGNGRSGRMLLNYMLMKTGLPPLDVPSQSLYYTPNDLLRKYAARMDRLYGTSAGATVAKYDFDSMRSFNGVKDIDDLTAAAKQHYNLEKLTIEHLHGTSGFIFVGHYKGRAIQFESTRFGEQLSDSLGIMVSRSEKIIDEQAEAARAAGKKPPSYAIYPELLEQNENYHQVYEEEFLKKKFTLEKKRPPNESEMEAIQTRAAGQADYLLRDAEKTRSDREYFEKVMSTPRVPEKVSTPEEVAERVLSITSADYKEKIYKAITEKASPGVRQSFVDIYNAFNSSKFDGFMADLSERALGLCRKAGECAATQRAGIPDKFLAQVLKQEADKRGIMLETLSRYVGREPGHLYLQRIRRGSLLIDDGAPGNHGMMPHGVQNLFIYEQLGKERAQNFFRELTGWTYERMFDSNAAFTPVPSTRDITRRQYWTGVFVAGNRSEVSRYGELVGEAGRYPGFLRDNGLELVAVEEIEKNLINDGNVIKARYKDKEFSFTTNRDGVPNADAATALAAVKREVDGAPAITTRHVETPPDAVARGVPIYGNQALARLELQNPAKAAEVLFRESATEELAAARRSYFRGELSLKELDKMNATYGYLEPPITGADSASRRLGYLRQEETYLTRLIALADVDKDAALAARLSLARAAVDAQLAGETRARAGAKGAKAMRRAEIEAANSDAAFARYQAKFPGRNLKQVLANAAEAKLYSALRSQDLIREMHSMSDARASVAEALASTAKSDRARALQLADDFIEVSGSGLSGDAGKRPAELLKKLTAKGWSDEEIGALNGNSLANPWVHSPAEPQWPSLSAASRGVLLEAFSKDANDSRDFLAVPSLGSVGKDAYKTAKVDLENRAKAIEMDVEAFTKLSAKDRAYRQGLADANLARSLIEERIAKLEENRTLLLDARPASQTEEKLAQDATSAVVHFLKTSPPETLSELKLDGSAIHADASGAESFRVYSEFKAKVSAMAAEDRAKVYQAVRASAKSGEGPLARGLAKAEPVTAEAFKSALAKADSLTTALGHGDADATAAALRDAKFSAADQAIANAVGAIPAARASDFERHADAVAELKKVEAENEKLVSNAERAEALMIGRVPSSLAMEKFQEKADRALAGLVDLSPERRAEITEALGKVAAADKTDKNAKAALEHLKALSTNPDMFETFRMAYVGAADSLAKEKDWKVAWELGVKKMLLESGYSKTEVMRVVDKESGLKFYQQTARCLGL